MAYKKLCFLSAFYFVVSCIFFSHSASTQEKNVYTIAVLNLDAVGISEVEAKILSDELRFQISKTLKSNEYKNTKDMVHYEIVERTEIEKILEEFDFEFSGCVSDSCAIEFGKMLQLDRMIIGSAGLIGQTYTVSVRIIDVETAKTIIIANRHHRGEIDEILSSVMPIVVDDLFFSNENIVFIEKKEDTQILSKKEINKIGSVNNDKKDDKRIESKKNASIGATIVSIGIIITFIIIYGVYQP